MKALEKFQNVLGNPSAIENERTGALLFIAHFVGDLHQPMHTGLEEDRGSDDVGVQFFSFPTNLHTLWDVYLPAGFAGEWKEYARRHFGKITEDQRVGWMDSDPADRTAEYHQLAYSHACYHQA